MASEAKKEGNRRYEQRHREERNAKAREAWKAKHAVMTDEEREAERAKLRERQKRYRERNRLALNARQREWQRRKRESQGSGN